MKRKALKQKEVELLLRLDAEQRRELLGEMQKRLVARKLAVMATVRAGKLRTYKPISNRRIEELYGLPAPSAKKRKRGRHR